MVINESQLLFDFPSESTLKFDETAFFSRYFSKQPAAKGVDIFL